MIPRLFFALLFCVLAGCSLPFFKPQPTDKPSATRPLTPGEKKARLKVLVATIKAQQEIIARYGKQATAKKQPDPLLFVSDVEYAEATARLAKAQAERDSLGN